MGRAEVESLLGSNKVRPIGSQASLLDIDPKDLDFSRLGSMVKFCKVLTILDTNNWNDIEKFLVESTPEHFSYLPEGKLKIGLSAYELKVTPRQLLATGLKIKKAGKEHGRSIRLIPNKESSLNSATVLYNGLTRRLGWELVFIRDNDKTIIAQSIAVQDIDAYRKRDRERPYRDAKVGMLPPKLAQIIVNLAVGNRNLEQNMSVLDPFCGTGVVLQEANLMGFSNLYGTDIDARMIEYTLKNLDWLKRSFGASHTLDLKVGDAAAAKWTKPFDIVACEAYLGKPLSSLPSPQLLDKLAAECDYIIGRFLMNLQGQTSPGFRLCIAVPAWKKQTGFIHLPTLDKLAKLGYNRVSFVHAGSKDLIYHRPGQIVGRELVVLQRT